MSVLNTPGSNAATVAEYVGVQALFLSGGLDHYNAETHSGRWSKGTLAAGLEFGKLALGVVGTGSIAQRKAGSLAIKIIASDSERFTEQVACSLGLERRQSLD